MKKLIFDQEEFQAQRIVKTDNSIIGYIGGTETFAFRGIKDFSNFKLVDEQGYPTEFDLDENLLLQQRLQATEDALLFLMDLQMNGGK